MHTLTSSSRPLLALSAALAVNLAACGGDDAYGGSDPNASISSSDGSGGSGTASGGTYGTDGSYGSESSDSASDSGNESTDGTSTDPTDSTTDDSSTGDDTTSTGGELCNDLDDVTLFLSPDDSNSMSSPVQARDVILADWNGYLNDVPLRMWEFFNYYTFDYPIAEPGTVVVTPELFRPSIDTPDEYILQIGVSSEALSNDNRPGMNITLVLDESGSMTGSPMEMQKEACRALASQLKEGDIVSMVGWDTSNAIKLSGYKVNGPDDETLLEKINALEPGGGTDLNGGLVAGYELAQNSYDSTRINRVVLMSDGGANAGVTDIDLIADGAGAENEDGIYLVGVGVGTGNYNDALMDTVTDVGKGASVFIPNEEEAWKVFGDNFVNTMSVAVRDVQVRLDMPPGFEIVKFSGEEYSDNPSEIEPQHLAPNDAMVFHQTIATCAPELVDDNATITVTARFKDAITFEQKEVQSTVSFGDLLGAQSPQVRKGAALYAYVEALKAKRSNDDSTAEIATASERLNDAQLMLPADEDLKEIASILEVLTGS